jgi:hypothetical protein
MAAEPGLAGSVPQRSAERAAARIYLSGALGWTGVARDERAATARQEVRQRGPASGRRPGWQTVPATAMPASPLHAAPALQSL